MQKQYKYLAQKTLSDYEKMPEGSFKDGYRNGYLDECAGRTSQIITSFPNSNYTRGYKQGQKDRNLETLEELDGKRYYR